MPISKRSLSAQCSVRADTEVYQGISQALPALTLDMGSQSLASLVCGFKTTSRGRRPADASKSALAKVCCAKIARLLAPLDRHIVMDETTLRQHPALSKGLSRNAHSGGGGGGKGCGSCILDLFDWTARLLTRRLLWHAHRVLSKRATFRRHDLLLAAVLPRLTADSCSVRGSPRSALRF